MNDKSDKIIAGLESALQRLAFERGAEVAAEIEFIVWANYHSGRIHVFLDSVYSDCLLDEYVTRVANQYQQWHDYLKQLQTLKNRPARTALFARLQKWASSLLRAENSPADAPNVSPLATECATAALHILLNSRFPYDVHFNVWAGVILNKVCRRFKQPGDVDGRLNTPGK